MSGFGIDIQEMATTSNERTWMSNEIKPPRKLLHTRDLQKTARLKSSTTFLLTCICVLRSLTRPGWVDKDNIGARFDT